MFDLFNRHIHYLRISVTDRCNLRCSYCMPEDGITLLPHSDVLNYDEITEVAKVAVEMGINKVRITGGEPLVRKEITKLVAMLSQIEGIVDLAMTTNGTLLAQYARSLKEAGLHRINISLDTIDPGKFNILTRFGNVEDVFRGIEAALEAGLTPIKINCVIQHTPEEPDAKAVGAFGYSKGIEVRYIHQMSLHEGHFNTVIGGSGGDCSRCNRLRLSANGKIKPCLFSDLEYDVRKLGIRKALEMALQNKPEYGTVSKNGKFYNIGG